MDSRPVPRKSRSSLIEWLIVVVILLAIAAVAIPGLLSSHRASNERGASTSLKTLSTAEADYRANDRDWNHVNDFWTADVKGLYTMTSAAERGARGGTTDPPIKLIELDVAAADADGSFTPAAGENMLLSAFASPAARQGYWYAALTADLSLSGGADATYRVDTGGTPSMGKCHNESKFGFVSFPDSSGSGKFVFIVNENNTIFRFPATGQVRTGTALPPGLDGFPKQYQNWPTDAFMRSLWGD